MPRVVSLTFRQAAHAATTEEVPILLATIRHPDITDGPLRLSGDPTERLSLDPLRYGTRSRGAVYDFVLMSAVLPDDQHGTPPATQIVFEQVVADVTPLVRAVRSPAEIDLELVLASAPDAVEDSWLRLEVVRASYAADRLTLDVTREPVANEPLPAARLSRARFPGLFY